ncbi:MAG: PLP-dependent transferase [Olegusella sp.]|nr:PLP-dependent transferase [Olegusella sp.]
MKVHKAYSNAKLDPKFKRQRDPEQDYRYSRISNPTCDALEQKISALEGGAAAMLTTSGQMATFLSVMNLCKAGIVDNTFPTPILCQPFSWEADIIVHMPSSS